MIEWIVAVLTWLAAPADAVEVVRPRAATCAMVAYSTLYRPPVIEPNDDEKLLEPGGGTPTAQPKQKRMVKRCVDGKCVITYE